MLEKKLIIKNPEENDTELPTVSGFITSLYNNTFCVQSRNLVGTPDSSFTFDKNEAVLQKAPIDGSIQKLVPGLLREQLLYQAKHPTLVVHLGELKIYDSLRPDCYWPHMVTGVYNIVHSFS